MTARTYVDAVGAIREWINGRTATLVGLGYPLQKGAHLVRLGGSRPAAYAYLEELPATTSADSPENPDMDANVSAQIYADTREAATAAAVALAEELSTELCGVPTTVPGAVISVVDDIQGPAWFPDGEIPRLILSFHARVRPI